MKSTEIVKTCLFISKYGCKTMKINSVSIKDATMKVKNEYRFAELKDRDSKCLPLSVADQDFQELNNLTFEIDVEFDEKPLRLIGQVKNQMSDITGNITEKAFRLDIDDRIIPNMEMMKLTVCKKTDIHLFVENGWEEVGEEVGEIPIN